MKYMDVSINFNVRSNQPKQIEKIDKIKPTLKKEDLKPLVKGKKDEDEDETPSESKTREGY